jgi:hypothetical protein
MEEFMFNFKITPLKDQFDDPYYPVLVENIRKGSKLVSGVVIFEHNRIMGKYDFRELSSILDHWPTTMKNTLKAEIQKAIFS